LTIAFFLVNNRAMQNRLTRKISSLLTTSALAATFGIATARPLRAQQPESTAKDSVQQTVVPDSQPGHTYWHHPDYDGVLDVWNCPQRGVCAKVHSINTQDKKVREAAAKTLKKKTDSVTDADVLKQFCGYEAQFSEMKQVEPGTWDGKIWIASRNTNFGVTLRQDPDGEHLNLRGYLLGFFKYLFLGDPFHVLGKTQTLDRIHNPPPACIAPPKT
jgi:hypothetical protein